jgi:hypothetical protein
MWKINYNKILKNKDFEKLIKKYKINKKLIIKLSNTL